MNFLVMKMEEFINVVATECKGTKEKWNGNTIFEADVSVTKKLEVLEILKKLHNFDLNSQITIDKKIVDKDLIDLMVRITTVRRTTTDTENLEQKLSEIKTIVSMG